MTLARFRRVYASVADRLRLTQTRLTSWLLLVFFVCITTLTVRSKSTRDPGSWFFEPNLAYTPNYSAVRQLEAEQFVTAADAASPFVKPNGTAWLCLGIPSIARPGVRYLRGTVGSLLAGLRQEERDGIHLKVFIPHTDPNVHEAYHEPGLSNLADKILLYNLTTDEFHHIRHLERQHGLHREKGRFDYTYLLKTCQAMNVPYIAILEDDVVALDGWYHRTLEALRSARNKGNPALRRSAGDFLYLRLFYTERYLGWNSEDWPTHSFWCFSAIILSAAAIRYLRSASPTSSRILMPTTSLAIIGILVPWAFLLTFAAGRIAVFTLSRGVNTVNNHGCCAHGLVFPAHKSLDLIQYYTEKKIGFADMLTEQYADENGEQRWASTPSVLQHVGAKSSKTEEGSEEGEGEGMEGRCW